MSIRPIAFLVAMLCTSFLYGGVIVSIDSGSLQGNGSTSIDVFARSSVGTLSLSGFNLTLQISGPTTRGTLSFSSGAGQVNTEHGDLRYVFFGVGDPDNFTHNVTSPTLLTATDFLNGSATVNLTTSNKLIATLELRHSQYPGLDPTGDTYEIHLLDDPQTFFYAILPGGISDDLTIDQESFDIGGSVRVNSAASTAVPEPSTAILLLALAGFLGFRQRRLLAWNSSAPN